MLPVVNTFTLPFTRLRSARGGLWLILLLVLAATPLHGENPATSISRPDGPEPVKSPRPAADARLHDFLARLGVDRWHRAGFRGRGVKVAILDAGFRGYRSFLGKTLPPHVTTHSFRLDGDLEGKASDHGVRCAEVVHALAPDAELLFLNWEPERPEQFLKAVRWAREQGARVVSCSLIMPSWSDGEGGGQVHRSLNRAVGPGDRPGDVLFFSSAGNLAQRHWTGKSHDDGQGFHEWRPGRLSNPVTPWGTGRVSVELYGQAGADYVLYVYDGSTMIGLGRSTAGNVSNSSAAVVHFWPQTQRHYQVRVRLMHGSPGPFHVIVLGGGLGRTTAGGSICFPADGPEVIAMGAVDPQGRRMEYSCCGPNSPRPKPDFVAPVPFPLTGPRPPFGGTSAAAPQGAALAALWLSRHPDWTAQKVRAAMRTSARDLGPPGHDFETGYGMVIVPPLTPPAAAAKATSSRPNPRADHETHERHETK
jgi:hypothetical protein